MRVLIFHGYLLRGTGSNVYTANLARALSGLGHEVDLLCQDHAARELPWVDAVGAWRAGLLSVEPTGGHSPGVGRITAYLPSIGGVLPVYVEDRYEHFEARAFSRLEDAEIDSYIDANVAAVRDVASRGDAIDAALANHLVMGPLILARAGLRFAAKVHGSALSYTVAPEPRFVPYAREGLEAAQAILVGSRHTAEQLEATLGNSGLGARIRLGPPGVDPDRFRPVPRSKRAAELRALAGELRRAAAGGAGHHGLGRDPLSAAAELEGLAAADGPRTGFVGKLIASKGPDLLLAAWPLVAVAIPGAELAVAGFGEGEGPARELWSALERGDLAGARATAVSWRAREASGAETGGRLRYLEAFLSDPPAGYADAGRGAAGTVRFLGRLEHSEVARLCGALDAGVVPSTFPEAFGMVAAEQAAAGALPVCAAHSGLAEVASGLAAGLAPEISRLVTFDIGPAAPREISSRLVDWLTRTDRERSEVGARLRQTVEQRWSWRAVAGAVIAAARGQLDALPSPRDP